MRSATTEAPGWFTGAGGTNGCDSGGRGRDRKTQKEKEVTCEECATPRFGNRVGAHLWSRSDQHRRHRHHDCADHCGGVRHRYSRWKDEAHFAAWLGLTPSRDISGGKVVRQQSRKVKNRVATALRTAAQTLLRSDSYLGARYRFLRTRLGAPKAIKAMARYLACLVYRLFTHGQAWVDRGAAQFEDRRQQRELAALQNKAAANGFKLVSLNNPT